MEAALRAVEVSGQVDAARRLHVDAPLPAGGPGRVRVIVLFPDEEDSEAEWMAAAARSSAFDFLQDPAEDIYSPTDGRPFGDPR